jgi:hypothetical protein
MSKTNIDSWAREAVRAMLERCLRVAAFERATASDLAVAEIVQQRLDLRDARIGPIAVCDLAKQMNTHPLFRGAPDA